MLQVTIRRKVSIAPYFGICWPWDWHLSMILNTDICTCIESKGLPVFSIHVLLWCKLKYGKEWSSTAAPSKVNSSANVLLADGDSFGQKVRLRFWYTCFIDMAMTTEMVFLSLSDVCSQKKGRTSTGETLNVKGDKTYCTEVKFILINLCKYWYFSSPVYDRDGLKLVALHNYIYL